MITFLLILIGMPVLTVVGLANYSAYEKQVAIEKPIPAIERPLPIIEKVVEPKLVGLTPQKDPIQKAVFSFRKCQKTMSIYYYNVHAQLYKGYSNGKTQIYKNIPPHLGEYFQDFYTGNYVKEPKYVNSVNVYEYLVNTIPNEDITKNMNIECSLFVKDLIDIKESNRNITKTDTRVRGFGTLYVKYQQLNSAMDTAIDGLSLWNDNRLNDIRIANEEIEAQRIKEEKEDIASDIQNLEDTLNLL